MIELGQHWAFIIAAHAGCFGIVAALIVWTMFDARRSRARVAQLEAAREAQRATKNP